MCTIDPTCCTVGWDAGCALLACSGPCSGSCLARAPAGADVSDRCFGAACCPAGTLAIKGTPGPDVPKGGAPNECLIGLEDADQLDGDLGNDALLCGPGADSAPGEAGSDTMLGGGDADTLTGGDGCDLIGGGQGDDTLRGGNDADTLVPGMGQDLTFGEAGHIGVRGATCNVPWEWSIVQGTGSLQVNAADSSRVVLLNPHAAPGEALDSVVLRAECGNDPSLFAEHAQTILAIPSGAAVEGNVGFVEGVGSAALEPFDEAMLDFMRISAIVNTCFGHREQPWIGIVNTCFGHREHGPGADESELWFLGLSFYGS